MMNKLEVLDYLNTKAPASATLEHLCLRFQSDIQPIIDELVKEGLVFYAEPVRTDVGTIVSIRTYQRQEEIDAYLEGGVIIDKVDPPLVPVSKRCGAVAMAVYAFLWESASKDVRYDKRLHLQWKDRRDTGGTTSWSIKGLADALGVTRKTAKSAVDKLLDAGFIQHINKASSTTGKYHSVFRVTHPAHLDAVSHANNLMVPEPSERRSRALNNKAVSLETGECLDYCSSYDERLEQMVDEVMATI